MKLIEKESVERDYGFNGTNAIIDSEKHGRLLIMDGFGGIDTLEGGAVRFRHGMVVKLKSDDTLDSLNSEKWNEYTSLMTAVCQGYDDQRPVLDWDGYSTHNTAKSVGLV